ncbi:MAG: AMP-binding protein [Acidimicrobiia bacterium]|nr:AMP-binding protein [Acidimicrobiia bacterium]
METNFATIWELIADAFGDRLAIADTNGRRTWAHYEDRASRLAAGLAARGVKAGDNVGICLHNSNPYPESQFALFKLRAAPFNVNYRYRTGELRSLLDDADATAVVFDHALADELEPVVDRLLTVKTLVQVGGETRPWAVDYESLIAGHDPAPRVERSADDLWILFTGGTTGHPKGVMWPHSSIIGLIGRNLVELFNATGLTLPDTAEGFVELIPIVQAADATAVQLAAAPLMHGTSGLTALQTLTLGGSIITLTAHSFDAAELWRTVDREGVTMISIVGDAFARPMLDELDAAAERGQPYDGSTVKNIVSSGVMWSAEVKRGLLEHLPEASMIDSLGSSEGAGIGSMIDTRDARSVTAKFELSDIAQVFGDDDQPVAPGSGQIGRVAVGGPLPLGYYKDPDKTAATWPTVNGQRWSMAGDLATVEADGTITLLGRGSNCINTGGEKVFPEEVEEALKLHPAVVDALAVGLPDKRWGQRVAAVVALRNKGAADGDPVDGPALIAFAKQHIAGYKVPKQISIVEQLQRKPNGKPDYAWAEQAAQKAPVAGD